MLRLLVLYLACGGLLGACASASVDTQIESWQAPLYQQHPLLGRIWDTREQRWIDAPMLVRKMAQTRYVLLGEKHDNPDHHRLQAFVLEQLQAADALASVSFEMLDSSQQASLASVDSAALASSAALKTHLSWDEQGWEWDFYGPMLYASLRAGLAVRAANISREEVLAVYGAEDSEAIRGILNAAQIRRLNQEIDESHCGMLAESQFAAMVRVQRTRDATMAQSLRESASDIAGARVLIAGNFHVRRDLGVPNYLPAKTDDVLSLAFVEVNPESVDPRDYLDASAQTLPYDYLWFTPAVDVEDYCAALSAPAS